jgi:hypothetical protein
VPAQDPVRLGPDERAKCDELIEEILADEDQRREALEQPELRKYLRERHELSDGDVDRVVSLIAHDAELETIRRGQQGGEAPPHGRFDMPDEGQRARQVPRGLDVEEWIGSNRPASRLAPPTPSETPEDDVQTCALKNFLSRFSDILDGTDIEHALEITREARRKQAAESRGSADHEGPIPFRGMPTVGGGMAGDSASSSMPFMERYPMALPSSRCDPSGIKVFVEPSRR